MAVAKNQNQNVERWMVKWFAIQNHQKKVKKEYINKLQWKNVINAASRF